MSGERVKEQQLLAIDPIPSLFPPHAFVHCERVCADLRGERERAFTGQLLWVGGVKLVRELVLLVFRHANVGQR